jgi:antitoxin (DNA-binding transcriptional repressor) of toxin-antitoxin stability system
MRGKALKGGFGAADARPGAQFCIELTDEYYDSLRWLKFWNATPPSPRRSWRSYWTEVERGFAVRIIRHGKAIARLVPEAEVRAKEVAEAIEGLRALRETFGKAPLDEVLATRHKGYKY